MSDLPNAVLCAVEDNDMIDIGHPKHVTTVNCLKLYLNNVLFEYLQTYIYIFWQILVPNLHISYMKVGWIFCL